MKTTDGRKLTVRDDWIESATKGTKSIADSCIWIGKTYFKVNDDGGVNERVRLLAEGMHRADIKDEKGVQIMDSQNLARVDCHEVTHENDEPKVCGSPEDESEGVLTHEGGQNAAPGEPEDDIDLLGVLLGEEGQEEQYPEREIPSGSRDVPGDAANRRDAIRDEAPEAEGSGNGDEMAMPEQDREARIVQAEQRDKERRMRKRSGDPNEAGTTQDLLTHYRKNIHCVACRQAKVTNGRFTRRTKPRETREEDAKFGRRVTADTIVLRNLKDRGIGGETNATVFYDLYSGWIDCIPVRSRVTEETVQAINQFKGQFSKACAIIGACNGTATPGMPRTNGIADSRVKEVLSGARVLLRQAGLEAKWWPYAVRAYCLHKNLRESEDGDTPYKKRHGGERPGIDLLPFGCLVDLLPIADKPRRPREGISDEQVKADEEAEEERVAAGDEDVSSIAAPAVKAKFDPPTSPGLHLGYAQLPGAKPNGDYFVAEMAHLLHAWEKPTVHQTKRIVPPEKEEWYFPMERVYEHRTRLMTESKAQAIARIEHDREKGYVFEEAVFDEGRKPKRVTMHKIEDDRKFIGEGDYWEHFPDERKWVLHHIMLRRDLVLPGDEALADGGPGRRKQDIPVWYQRVGTKLKGGTTDGSARSNQRRDGMARAVSERRDVHPNRLRARGL